LPAVARAFRHADHADRQAALTATAAPIGARGGGGYAAAVSRRTLAPVVAAVALLAAGGPARAAAVQPTFEVVASGGWRTSIDVYDRAPGFQAVGAGGEVFVGAAWGGVGLAAGGRVRGGGVRGVGFVDAGGDLALQLLVGERTRLRLGAEAGRAFLGDASAWFAGGFLEGSFDIAQLRGGRAALIFNLRIDIDEVIGDDLRFPKVSTAIAAGFGFRY